jgi:hypothetical protein
MLRCFGESSGLAVGRVILALCVSWWRPARRYMESALLEEQCRYLQSLYGALFQYSRFIMAVCLSV